jgi:hypothetical protein
MAEALLEMLSKSLLLKEDFRKALKLARLHPHPPVVSAPKHPSPAMIFFDHEMLHGPQINDQLVDVLMKTIEGDDWEEICNADGIRVCRNKLSPDLMIAGRPVRFLALFPHYLPPFFVSFSRRLPG